MSNRWKMNRIGFVNFWLYDEEDFEFVDGKLLLRGQNGSGKSITTQSFIPFVLDGDRTPSRLDPFGSSDRRMEYYFLGEEGKDEATGYLYLELKKEETGEYRTIGIGQRAKRGKPMDFWGFIVLDGRRIGQDFQLYKEVGTTRIPYDKREMRAALGEENFFTDSQSEYKKHVNQYIFGFRKEEQYEQFIRLLVKVRAPKLSKEFKPTKVYEILNDSLQTLTDEDLRAMVDAMEKMDEIQESLDTLKRAFEDVKIIRNEYIRYNQYMLAKKAQAYLAEKQETEGLQLKLDEKRQEMQELEEHLKTGNSRLAKLEEQRKLAETEKNGLLDTDLEETDSKLTRAREQRAEALADEKRWDDRIQNYKARIWEGEQKRKELLSSLEQRLQQLQEDKRELEQLQEILQWEYHKKAVQLIETENSENTDEIGKNLELFRKLIGECKKVIGRYEELSGQYDAVFAELEQIREEKKEKGQRLFIAGEQVTNFTDQWVTALFEAEKTAEWWKPKEGLLPELEQKIRQYRSMEDAEEIQKLLRGDYERQRRELLDKKAEREYEKSLLDTRLNETKSALAALKNQEELEPDRDENTELSRIALQRLGIEAVPFYKTVEFSEELDEAGRARLEAQLQRTGLLDALVVSGTDYKIIREQCPEFLDSILLAEKQGNSGFLSLTVSEELDEELKENVKCILSNIYENKGNGQEIVLRKDGWFSHGILQGKADKCGQAEFVGLLARKRRRERKIQEQEQIIREISEHISVVENDIVLAWKQLEILQAEYEKLPGFTAINRALDNENSCRLELLNVTEQCAKKEVQERELAEKKNQQYQAMIQKCKTFPYGRTMEAYEEVSGAIEEYQNLWQEIRQSLLKLSGLRSDCSAKQDGIDRDGQLMDEAFVEKRGCSTKVKEYNIQIRQFEEYLSRPEIAEKAMRLKQLREELIQIAEESSRLNRELAVLTDRLEQSQKEVPEIESKLRQKIILETCLRNYFEEELSLKLVFDRESRTLSDSAKEAVGILREGDKNRESADMFQALYQVYQRHNGSLTNYGTNLENCFEADIEGSDLAEIAGALRKRVRVVSTWNGKKVYLEEFYGILKAAIDETELLIQKKDRELFEDILSQTISQQLTDRIAESRKWVADMSVLMREMDTSMGLSFSLDWKPRKAENDMEIDTAELEQILLRDRALLTLDDIEKVAAHFRSRIRMEKQKVEESGSIINYMDLVRDALDYRQWFEFHMFFRKGEEPKKLLTNAAFNRFSGGEKAMAMYVPLFAAVNAQYKKAEKKDHPRMVALDEAFAGVDDKNISSMFELVHKLDFDYIMNSQALWGCFETVRGLRIAELLRPQNSQIVSVIRYTWNGHERILDVQ